MKASYQILPQTSSRVSEEFDVHAESNCCKRNDNRKTLRRLLVILIITNVLSLTWGFWQPKTVSETDAPSDYARVEDLDVVWKRFWWNSAYSSENRTQNDALWDAILPSHGIVAITKSHAAAMHWPDSLSLPSDHSKMTYLLEGYHQLHCLRILRKTFWEAVEGRPYTHHPSKHMEHCFDTLRQSVQCYADNTPLYSFGDFTAGDGQMHRCRNWDQLRDWATEHTACYRDSVEGIPLRDHFGFCDDGSDGVGEIDEGVNRI